MIFTRRSQKGLTLIELVVVTAIIAILASVAFPSTKNLIDRSQRSAVINNLLGFLAMGRERSVLTGTILTLCPLKSDNTCGKDWTTPLTLFRDPGNKRTVANQDQIIHVLMPPKRGFLKVASLHRSFFQYRPDGMIFSDLGNITWCPDDKDPTKAAHFVIRKGGTIRLAKDTNGDGIPDKANGKLLEC
ncbi:pilus assembly FimT family protein [Methylophaga sp.]|uniref:pilus assembly FimT family protein n=1 Tax=Methylophaga sp. TaxID=2024840 RepID=UPI003A8E9515